MFETFLYYLVAVYATYAYLPTPANMLMKFLYDHYYLVYVYVYATRLRHSNPSICPCFAFGAVFDDA